VVSDDGSRRQTALGSSCLGIVEEMGIYKILKLDRIFIPHLVSRMKTRPLFFDGGYFMNIQKIDVVDTYLDMAATFRYLMCFKRMI
jgi:hypothetical protein